MDRTNDRRWVLLICALLPVLTLAAYWPVLSAEFIHYDDPQYVTGNSHVLDGLKWEHVKWAFQSGYAENWHPLTWLTHMLDVQLFGLNAARHHLTNLLLHTAASLLLFLWLRMATGTVWRGAFVAGLFALHPLHVESVAWVSERKDVLSAFFFMLTLLAYTRYARGSSRREEAPSKIGGKSSAKDLSLLTSAATRKWYVLTLVCFALGLMSKPMLVTVPFVLLLLDFWPLRRVEGFKPNDAQWKRTWVRLIWEKAPFFALTFLSCIVTMQVQQLAMVDVKALPFPARFQNALLSYVTYLVQLFWPTNLAVFYPYPNDFSPGSTFGVAALLAALTSGAVFVALRRPYIPVGWFWYLGMLVPVIGVIQVGSQTRADRYTYLPAIGIFLAVVWALVPAPKAQVEKKKSSAETDASSTLRGAGWVRIAPACAIVLLCMLGFLTHRQATYWRSSETLFRHAAEVTPENYAAWGGLGIVELRRNNPSAALTNLYRALEYAEPRGAAGNIKYFIGAALQVQSKGLEALPWLEASSVLPEQKPERSYRLALSLIEAGRLKEAESHLKESLAAKPDNADFQLGSAALLQAQGQTNRAGEVFERIVSQHPELGAAQRSYADFLAYQGRLAEAEPHYAAARKLLPADARLCRAYAKALVAKGQNKLALEELQAAVKLAPTDVSLIYELAGLLSLQGRNHEALEYYNRAIEAEPKSVAVLNDLAWILATTPDDKIRDGPRAVKLAERACQLTEWKAALLMGTLAAAYAEAGQFTNAVTMAEKARDTARAGRQETVAQRNEELLSLYRSGKPFRETQ